ncbi:MAG: ABC transporter ATP-binding protein [Planctomycetota bacterium]|nr:ABC transporter ATP-binding protein [Planctomycetota bacterium]
MSSVSNQKALAIEICDFEKTYGKTSVLNRLNLQVQQSELLVILGESGSGKSTLLRLIAGLEKPQSGKMRINGVDQFRVKPHKRDVAIVFQHGNGYGHLTVRQNLDLAAKYSSQSDQLDRWVEWLKIGPTLGQKLSQLSGGQAQRVAIARAMLSGKSIVLMDEPLAHLNQLLREEIRELVSSVQRETKRTIVYVTHDSDEAFYLATRVAVLNAGQIQQLSDPQSVFCKPSSKAVAKLLGQPTLDVIDLPTKWFDGAPGSESEVCECGVRSHDWRIERIHVASFGQVETRKIGTSLEAGKVLLNGVIVGCHWLGNRWLIEIDCPQRVRITCPTPAPESLERSLVAVLNAVRSGAGSECLGYLDATIERSCVRMFGGAQSHSRQE